MEGCAERKRIGLGKGAASANAKGKLETLTPRLSPDPSTKQPTMNGRWRKGE